MQFGQVEAFVEVARKGSISRAAESLCLTQPTVTERLHSLEVELGDKLFNRVKYGVTLTDAGKLLLPYAERTLRTLADAKAALENLRDGTQGNLVLGSAPFISMYLLPTLLDRYMSKHPNVHVAVRTGHSEEVLQMVLHEEVQIGLVRNMRHPDIEAMTLHNDELILVARPSHPFCNRPHLTIEEVASEGVVLFDDTNNYYQLVNGVFLSVGLVLKARFEMDNVESAKKMVEQGLGISLLPRIAVQKEIALGTLKELPIIDGPTLQRELVAICHKTSGLGGIARAFLDTVKEMSSATPLL
ncbi:MAG: LysR family transcriptional regulator [Chloroflexota bacterium]|nr:MAG: LysR family transcriptional regulator [Chloroflexota bacterium]